MAISKTFEDPGPSHGDILKANPPAPAAARDCIMVYSTLLFLDRVTSSNGPPLLPSGILGPDCGVRDSHTRAYNLT